jgi:hypothetical protein
MLDPQSQMVMVTIEGTSPAEQATGVGEEVIDLAEYYGTADVATAERVIYRQFKHSTVNDRSEWTSAWMKTTFVGFAKKYASLRKSHPSAIGHVEYILTTNRPGKPAVHQALDAMRNGTRGIGREVNGAITYLSKLVAPIVGDEWTADFVGKFRVEDSERGLIDQRDELQSHVSSFLPGAHPDAYILLKEMIARRATSEYAARPVITRHDVLAALQVIEDDILPAPGLFAPPEHLLKTDQFRVFAEFVAVQENSTAVVGHASGGVGKSVLAHAFGSFMPAGSITILYDCFGNGTYRRPSSPRHEPRQALVQICNELAAKGLCDLVLPSLTAHESDYFRIFRQRLEQACELLAQRDPQSLLTIAVDAADNAELIARDTGSRSFAVSLLRQDVPTNCRLVLFCRTERMDLLSPPPTAAPFELKGFSREDTARFLHTRYSSVANADVAEFHRVTHGHPRAQAAALESKTSVQHALDDLGGIDSTPEAIIYKSIHDAIDNARDAHDGAAREVDLLCEALAALRPMVPADVLAAVAGVPEPLVHSFVSDLGRPLLIDSGAVQFRDEPTETWFHENCRPTGARLHEFLERVSGLADRDPYLATSLPDLLLEAGRIDDLVQRALDLAYHAVGKQFSHRESDLEKYEIAQHTVQVALKGALRGRHELAAARLALNAGKLAAGHGRRLKLIRDNPDLASEFLDASLQEHLIATRALSGDWPGANIISESAMLATASGQQDLARHRLRSAVDWTVAWVNRPRTAEDNAATVETRDIADLAWAALNTGSPTECAAFLSRWTPLTIAFDAGLILARRLGDAGRTEDLFELVRGARQTKHLKFAVAQVLWEYDIEAPDDILRTLVSTLKRHRKPITLSGGRPYDYSDELPGLDGIVWMIALGCRSAILKQEDGVRLLNLYFPESLGSASASYYRPKTTTLLRGFALRCHLNGTELDAEAIADRHVKEARTRPHRDSRTLHEHAANIVPLCQWTNLWAATILGSQRGIEHSFDKLRVEHMRNYSDYDPPRFLINAMPRIAARILARIGSRTLSEEFVTWCVRNANFLSWSTLTEVIRLASGASDLHIIVPAASQLLRDSVTAAHEESSSACDALVSLARALYRFKPSECREQFHEALEISEHAGDDLYDRWRSFTVIAENLGRRSTTNSKRAQNLLQIAESVVPYTGDAIWMADPLAIAARLSPVEAIAGASRWRDRRVADIGDISAAFTRANGVLAATPTIALAFAPLGQRVPRVHWLTAAIRSTRERATMIAKVFGDFERSEPRSENDFAQIDSAATATGITLEATKYDPQCREVRNPIQSDGASGPTWQSMGAGGSSKRAVIEPFKGFDFRTPEGWNAALRAARGRISRGTSDDVINAALGCAVTDLADVLAGFRGSDEFDLFDCKAVLHYLDSIDYPPLALRSEVRKLCDVLSTRFPQQLTCAQYEPLDLDVLARLTGWKAEDFIGRTLVHLGELPTRLDFRECYSLAIRLGDRLSDEDAAAVFDECASLFRDIVPGLSSQDDDHTSSLEVTNLTESVAALLWAALGDSSAEIRWRTAHTVSLLLQFGEVAIAKALFTAAIDARWTTGFVDPRVVFYHKHALQWLMFALARASQSQASHAAVKVFEPLLKSILLEQAPHVVIQESARRCVEHLHSAGLIDWSRAEMNAIAHIGAKIGVMPEIAKSNYRRRVVTLADLIASEADGADLRSRIVEFDDEKSMDEYLGKPESRYMIDFRDDWCEPLGDAFGLHRDAVERLVGDVVVAEASDGSGGPRSPDVRRDLGFYRRPTHTYGSDWPEDDDLDFYRATHALCQLAGRLVRQLPVWRRYEDGDDEYDRFLTKHRLTRSDARWLADRRDLAPLTSSIGEFSPTKSEDRDDWLFAITRGDFDEILEPSSTTILIWGEREIVTRTRSVHSYVRSSLIDPVAGEAFLRAVRSARFTTPLTLPAAGDYESSSAGRFSLKGWIQDHGANNGRDSQDPFARRICYPPTRPCSEITAEYDLRADTDMRAWRQADRAVFNSTVWDEREHVNQSDMVGSAGDELEVDREFLTRLLTNEGRSLLVQVTIHPYSHHESRSYTHLQDDDNPSYAEPSTMYYVIGKEGRRDEL